MKWIIFVGITQKANNEKSKINKNLKYITKLGEFVKLNVAFIIKGELMILYLYILILEWAKDTLESVQFLKESQQIVSPRPFHSLAVPPRHA